MFASYLARVGGSAPGLQAFQPVCCLPEQRFGCRYGSLCLQQTWTLARCAAVVTAVQHAETLTACSPTLQPDTPATLTLDQQCEVAAAEAETAEQALKQARLACPLPPPVHAQQQYAPCWCLDPLHACAGPGPASGRGAGQAPDAEPASVLQGPVRPGADRLHASAEQGKMRVLPPGSCTQHARSFVLVADTTELTGRAQPGTPMLR